jgi:hypothetical protein
MIGMAIRTTIVRVQTSSSSTAEAHGTQESHATNLQPRLNRMWQLPRKLWHYPRQHAWKRLCAPKTMAIDRQNGSFLQPRPENYGNRRENAGRTSTRQPLVATTSRFYRWQKSSFSLCGNHISEPPLNDLSRPAQARIVSFRENSQYWGVNFKQHCRFFIDFIN